MMCNVTLSTFPMQGNLLEPEMCEWQKVGTVSNLTFCLKDRVNCKPDE
jgi:hypothetical protein